jgi:hypothetical protein
MLQHPAVLQRATDFTFALLSQQNAISTASLIAPSCSCSSDGRLTLHLLPRLGQDKCRLPNMTATTTHELGSTRICRAAILAQGHVARELAKARSAGHGGVPDVYCIVTNKACRHHMLTPENNDQFGVCDGRGVLSSCLRTRTYHKAS